MTEYKGYTIRLGGDGRYWVPAGGVLRSSRTLNGAKRIVDADISRHTRNTTKDERVAGTVTSTD